MRKVITDKYIATEEEFYSFYFNILNLKRPIAMKLTATEIELLSKICCKSLDYGLKVGRSVGNISKMKEMSNGTKSSEKYMYKLKYKLMKKGLLVKDEDDFITLPKAIQGMRRVIKDNIASGKSFEFDYIFNFTINDNGSLPEG